MYDSLERTLAEKRVTIITNTRKNRKPKLMKIWDRLLFRKRFIIETVFNQLKNISQIDHFRYRSGVSFMVNLNYWTHFLYVITKKT
uniref:transposase n=1 Tax=Candidatus Enterovibrio escicola TaxID=1927127 RepID=UPI001CC26FC1|nr:transposase [Candidatus Enterovibrio escacola]